MNKPTQAELQSAIARHVQQSAEAVRRIPFHERTILSKREASLQLWRRSINVIGAKWEQVPLDTLRKQVMPSNDRYMELIEKMSQEEGARRYSKCDWRVTTGESPEIDTINVLYDMETQDPDDLFALAILASHPRVRLRAVCLTPGGLHQTDLIRHVLKTLRKSDVPIGSFDLTYAKDPVGAWWRQFLGDIPYEGGVEPQVGWEVYDQTLSEYPDLVVITGAAPKNLGAFLRVYDVSRIERWVAQGGFAGDSVVPPEHRLDKFAGRETCATFNFNGDPKSALLALGSENILERRLVSKNVCHGLVYDKEMHSRMTFIQNKNRGLHLLYRGMAHYLERHPSGKLFHDPLAVCAAINPGVLEYREVELYREKGKWGSRLCSGTNTWISIKADHEAFFKTMVGEKM
jgi:pyrimidine-specific ribonucleoside hydrolase